jgi:uncharacterized protein (DUF362 family)
MGTNLDPRIRRNLLLLIALALLLFGTAVFECNLGRFVSGFGVVILAGLAAVAVLAVVERTGRILSLLGSVFAIELVKEYLGIRYGLWVYHGARTGFLTGVLSWVLAGASMYTLSKFAVAPFVRAILPTKSRAPHLPILMGIVVLAVILLNVQSAHLGVWMWVLYALLLVLAVLRMGRMDLATLVATLLCAWGVGNLSEYLGSRAGIWTFPGHPVYPPLYLVFGLWPIEALGQFALSRLLVRGETKFDATADWRLSLGWSAPWTAEEEKLSPLARPERIAQIFFRISAGVYFVVGWMFILLPDTILTLANQLSAFLVGPRLPPIPVTGGHFWTSLAFSMMMTITAICIAGQYNIRQNRNLLIMLLISKAASSLSGFALFFGEHPYFAYLAIGLVDGSLCVASLYFYLLGSTTFFSQQTFYTHESPPPLPKTPATTVVSLKDAGLAEELLKGHPEASLRKLTLLERALDHAGFWRTIVQARGVRDPAGFKVVIKPNFMFSHAKEDPSTYTDPELVMHLVDLLRARGYTHVKLVEAQSTYGNYYQHRSVTDVAAVVGYDLSRYDIVDLTVEKQPYRYPGRLGLHVVGPTWRDADFRVSFAKNKTHVFCNYTLAIKNIYGTLPEQDKLKEYHTLREYDWPTIESIAEFPVHFGIVDAIISADGPFGVIASAGPRKTDTIIAGENIIAVDTVGARKMGLDPKGKGIGRFLPLAIERFGEPESITVIGDESLYQPWTNVSPWMVKPLDLLEESYTLSNWWFACFSAMSKAFPPKADAPWHIRFLRWSLSPLRRILYPHDYLGTDPDCRQHPCRHGAGAGAGADT